MYRKRQNKRWLPLFAAMVIVLCANCTSYCSLFDTFRRKLQQQVKIENLHKYLEVPKEFVKKNKVLTVLFAVGALVPVYCVKRVFSKKDIPRDSSEGSPCKGEKKSLLRRFFVFFFGSSSDKVAPKKNEQNAKKDTKKKVQVVIPEEKKVGKDINWGFSGSSSGPEVPSALVKKDQDQTEIEDSEPNSPVFVAESCEEQSMERALWGEEKSSDRVEDKEPNKQDRWATDFDWILEKE